MAGTDDQPTTGDVATTSAASTTNADPPGTSTRETVQERELISSVPPDRVTGVPPGRPDDSKEVPTGRLSQRLTGERYEIYEQLGRGGMGEVMDAHDRQIGRDVAIKRMRAEAPSNRAIVRFLREAMIQGRLDHPAIVPVHELGRDVDGRPYFAMKKLAGTTLASLLVTGNPPRQRLLRAFADVCLAIEFAHMRGVIHRDLKPENIMLGDFGETYVLDWGVAKLIGEDDDRDLVASDALGTAAGTVIGTPGYMAPEQALGNTDIDARVDVYALGCVLFEILTGSRLHPRGRPGLSSAIAGPVDRPSSRAIDRDIPLELDELCAQATTHDREQRIATARELGERVQRYLDGDRDLNVRRSLATDHLAAATEAFSSGDRRVALREAARALALDPRLGDAADLVTRVMMEPPAKVPPEIEVALDSDSDHVVRRVGKSIALTNLSILLFVPFMVGRVHPGYIAMLIGIVAIKIAVTWGMTWWGTGLRYARLGLNVLMLVLIARLSSPVLFAPGIAAITAVGLMSGTFRKARDGILVGAGLTLAIVLPWLGEQLGYLSVTMWTDGGKVVLDSPFLDASSGFGAVVLWPTALIAMAIVTTHSLRLAEHSSRRQVRLQAWQLGQLVPNR